jgi:hypothetical protein
MNVKKSFPQKDYTGTKVNKLLVLKFKEYKVKPYGRIPVWECKCDCGNFKDISTTALTNGQYSCGCALNAYRKNHKNARTLPPGEAMFNNLYNTYTYRAKRNGIVFDINKSDFRILTKQKCFYCNSSPSTICGKNFNPKLRNGTYIFNGLDRIIPHKGYVLTNVVTCCEICNKAKRDLPYKKFIEWIKNITTYANKINCNYTIADTNER